MLSGSGFSRQASDFEGLAHTEFFNNADHNNVNKFKNDLPQVGHLLSTLVRTCSFAAAVDTRRTLVILLQPRRIIPQLSLSTDALLCVDF